MRTVIFAAGQIRDYEAVRRHLGAVELVLCADGGVRHALALGLTPALMLGDFDSTDPALVAEMAARGIPIERMPVEKDETDTHLALAEAVRRGATEILLVGASGDRVDHTVSNLLLLPGVPAHIAVTLVDEKNVVRVLRPGGRLTITGEPGEYLSLLPLSPEVTGVVAEGVKWPLNNATLRWGESLGVSNQFVEAEAFVATREGYLLVIRARD
ncbi:MAG TPA: thiamine diphosphokinase [Symbiobacteriaceae bacterium]